MKSAVSGCLVAVKKMVDECGLKVSENIIIFFMNYNNLRQYMKEYIKSGILQAAPPMARIKKKDPSPCRRCRLPGPGNARSKGEQLPGQACFFKGSHLIAR
jgi:hypothetical protein